MVQRNAKLAKWRSIVRGTIRGIPKSASGAKRTKCGRLSFRKEGTLPSQPPVRNPTRRAPTPMLSTPCRLAAAGSNGNSENLPPTTGDGESVSQGLGIRFNWKSIPDGLCDYDGFGQSVRLLPGQPHVSNNGII